MAHILIIQSRLYEEIADMLLEGAIAELENSRATYENISVPTAFEMPAALSMAISTAKYDAYIILGCVIKGQASYYDHVTQECSRGINNLAVQFGLAIGYGVLTVENYDQAIEQANEKLQNKGGMAAKVALRMLEIQEYFDASSEIDKYFSSDEKLN